MDRFNDTCPLVVGLLSAIRRTMASFSLSSPLPPPPLLLLLSPAPHSSSASLHPRNVDFQPQGLKSSWRGVHYSGKETQKEGGGNMMMKEKEDEEQDCCLLEEIQKIDFVL